MLTHSDVSNKWGRSRQGRGSELTEGLTIQWDAGGRTSLTVGEPLVQWGDGTKVARLTDGQLGQWDDGKAGPHGGPVKHSPNRVTGGGP
ncbi:hypothetical protein chiPu_0027014 [Chiloscyllium punctatum]|uniref:Uncharacterized protein n=1 Tax=Chiloscyllium punctatum TaxID=137246 RepID=A0A401TK01_CHIPU|nr:hypothetical protein [Chiloscyllium punctatum]